MNLYAYCKQDGVPQVKHIPVTRDVQNILNDVFGQQEQEFRDTRTNAIEFDGNYKADDNEYLTLEATDEIESMTSSSNRNTTSLDKIDTENFSDERIKALFVRREDKLLIQRFTSLQLLNRRDPSFWLTKNTFQRISTPAFTIGSRLCCIIENNLIKFDSFTSLRAIFDLKDFYQEATDADIEKIVAHGSIDIPDLENFKKYASQTVRKLIYKVLHSEILDGYKVDTTQEKAKEIGIDLEVQSGKIVLSCDNRENRKILSFLDESYFESNLTGNKYVTNSKRPAESL